MTGDNDIAYASCNNQSYDVSLLSNHMDILDRIKANYWYSSGLLNFLQNALNIVLSFASFYFLVRLLTKQHFGAWVLFLATINVMEFARSGLITKSLITYLSASRKRYHLQISSSSFAINIVLTLIIGACGLLISPLLGRIWDIPQLQDLMNIYLIAFAISCLTIHFNAIEQATLRFTGVFYASVVRQLIVFITVATCYFMHAELTLVGLVYIHVAGIILSTYFAWRYVHKSIKMKFSFDRGWSQKLLNYGKYSFGTSLTAMISSSLDQMILGALLATSTAGAYNIAIRVTNMVDIPTNAMATIVFPQSVRLQETTEQNQIKRLYEKSVGAVLALLIPALLVVFLTSETIIRLLTNDMYPESAVLLRVTLLYVILIPFTRQFGTMLESNGKVKLNFQVTAIFVAINIGLNLLLISWMGITGAAYATLISYCLLFVISQVILRRTFQVSAFAPFRDAAHLYKRIYHSIIS